MSTSAIVPEVAAPAPTVKTPLLPMLLCCVVAGVLAASGGGLAIFYLARSGKLPVTLREAAPEPKETPAAELHRVNLDPMLANLADADAHSFVRVGVALGEAPEPGKKKAEEGKPQPGADAAVRDVVLGVLGRHKAADLLVPDGKERLKVELKEAFAAQTPEAHVQAVYFTEFLVQR